MAYVQFPVGSFRCTAVSDGYYDYEPETFFENLSNTEIESEMKRLGITTNIIRTPYTFLVVETGQHRILVDMGGGSLAATTGRLVESIRSAGLHPDDIDTVFVTHAHPDHIGGALSRDGALNYANARYYVRREEWNFWFSDEPTSLVNPKIAALGDLMVKTARKNLTAIGDQTTIVESDDEVLPGVSLRLAPGHTPGHAIVVFESDGQTLVYAADVVLSPSLLEHPTWYPVYDVDRRAAQRTVRRLAREAEEKNWLVMLQHFPPFPSLGRIRASGNGWQWVPEDV